MNTSQSQAEKSTWAQVLYYSIGTLCFAVGLISLICQNTWFINLIKESVLIQIIILFLLGLGSSCLGFFLKGKKAPSSKLGKPLFFVSAVFLSAALWLMGTRYSLYIPIRILWLTAFFCLCPLAFLLKDISLHIVATWAFVTYIFQLFYSLFGSFFLSNIWVIYVSYLVLAFFLMLIYLLAVQKYCPLSFKQTYKIIAFSTVAAILFWVAFFQQGTESVTDTPVGIFEKCVVWVTSVLIMGMALWAYFCKSKNNTEKKLDMLALMLMGAYSIVLYSVPLWVVIIPTHMLMVGIIFYAFYLGRLCKLSVLNSCAYSYLFAYITALICNYTTNKALYLTLGGAILIGIGLLMAKTKKSLKTKANYIII